MKSLTSILFVCAAMVAAATASEFEAHKWRYGVRFSSPEEEHLRYVFYTTISCGWYRFPGSADEMRGKREMLRS